MFENVSEKKSVKTCLSNETSNLQAIGAILQNVLMNTRQN